MELSEEDHMASRDLKQAVSGVRRYAIRISGPRGMILSRLLCAVRAAAEAQLAMEHPAPELAIIQVDPLPDPLDAFADISARSVPAREDLK